MQLIDTHAHLFDEAFDEDREAVLQRALAASVSHILLPAIDASSHERLIALSRAHPAFCLPMMGLHPTSVNEIIESGGRAKLQWELEQVSKMLKNPPVERFYAIGEVGLDLYWSTAYAVEQVEAFRFQIELALSHDLPLAIHTRNAWPEMLDVLTSYSGCGLRGVMHAYSGTPEDALRLRSCGDFLLGIGGVVTYKKSALAELLPALSPDDLVLETDAPYLTPVPYRGQRNESSYLTLICEKVADIYGLTPDEIAGRTTANACRMFGVENLRKQKIL